MSCLSLCASRKQVPVFLEKTYYNRKCVQRIGSIGKVPTGFIDSKCYGDKSRSLLNLDMQLDTEATLNTQWQVTQDLEPNKQDLQLFSTSGQNNNMKNNNINN